MPAASDELELIELWPTLFLNQRLPGHEAHTERLLALARSRSEDGVFAIVDPSVEWLKPHVAHGVNAYLSAYQSVDARQWSVRGWFERLEQDDYQGLHDRPGADLCGMYVLSSADDGAGSGRRDDLRPGCVSFFDPRPAMHMNAISGDPYQRYQHTLRPVPGLLVLWPAFVSHFVHPNLAREEIVRIAFEVSVSDAGIDDRRAGA